MKVYIILGRYRYSSLPLLLCDTYIKVYIILGRYSSLHQ